MKTQPNSSNRTVLPITNAAVVTIAANPLRLWLSIRNRTANLGTSYVSFSAAPTSSANRAEIPPNSSFQTDYQGIVYLISSIAGAENLNVEEDT